jgi:hypothetical protein
MKTFQQFNEDIEQRRQQLAQRQLNQVAAQKERVANYQSSQREKNQASTEREALKKEIKRELQDEN